ncbi:hypothetical protein EJB05_50492, partial [Eragrostis curvula]
MPPTPSAETSHSPGPPPAACLLSSLLLPQLPRTTCSFSVSSAEPRRAEGSEQGAREGGGPAGARERFCLIRVYCQFDFILDMLVTPEALDNLKF